MAGSSSTSEYLNSKQRVLNKKQIETIVGSVEAVDRSKVLKSVKDDVGGGRHLDVFQDRRSAWNAVSVDPKFDLFVLSAVKKYTTLVRQCCVGRDKYSNLLVKWMEFVRSVLNDSTCQSSKEWCEVKTSAGVRMSESTDHAIASSVLRSVFNYCQHVIVAAKEGETLLLDDEQCDSEFAEAGLDIDETSLYRLGGYALHSAIEAYEAPTNSVERESILGVLTSLRLPVDEKVGLPSNIQHLDKQGMTFMKKELLGYLFKVRITS